MTDEASRYPTPAERVAELLNSRLPVERPDFEVLADPYVGPTQHGIASRAAVRWIDHLESQLAAQPGNAPLQMRADLGRIEHDTIVDAWAEEDCIHKRMGLGWNVCDHPLGLLLRRINNAQLDHVDQVRRIKEIREGR